MDNTILIMSVVACNEYCNVPNLYMCCNRLYILWQYHRDRIILNMISTHSRQQRTTNEFIGKCPAHTSMQWGPIRLYYASTTPITEYSSCGKLHYNYIDNSCRNPYCKVYVAKLITVSEHQSYMSLHKYDIMNNICYIFAVDLADPPTAIKYMYDCSQLPHTCGHARISVCRYISGCGYVSIYRGLLIFDSSTNDSNIDPCITIIDGRRVSNIIIESYHRHNTQHIPIITNNIDGIIAYMRSPIIDSTQMLGQSFVDACKRCC